MASLRVKNWAKFQHYKDRCPPWIKLATDTFQNYDFSRLQDASKLLAVCIWTLAARSQDGNLPHDFEYIKTQCCLGNSVKLEHLKELITQGFIESDSNMLADCKQSACLEGETEGEGETETEKREKRATRIPQNFSVTDAHRTFAAEHSYPNPDNELHKFVNHYIQKPGKDGKSLDWDARFKTWLSRAEKYGGSNGRKQQTYADRNEQSVINAVRASIARDEDVYQEADRHVGDSARAANDRRTIDAVRRETPALPRV